MVKLKLTGVEELNKTLKEVGSEARQALEEALEEAIKIIAEDARSNCPVDTGAARLSIKYQVGTMKDGTLYAMVTAGGESLGVDTYYVTFLEYGTKYMKNHKAFLRPALKSNRTKFKEIVKNHLQVVIEKERTI